LKKKREINLEIENKKIEIRNKEIESRERIAKLKIDAAIEEPVKTLTPIYQIVFFIGR